MTETERKTYQESLEETATRAAEKVSALMAEAENLQSYLVSATESAGASPLDSVAKLQRLEKDIPEELRRATGEKFAAQANLEALVAAEEQSKKATPAEQKARLRQEIGALEEEYDGWRAEERAHEMAYMRHKELEAEYRYQARLNGYEG